MTQNSKTPKIRFAGFTDDWEQRKLGDIADFNPKAELPEVFEYVDLESVVGTEMIFHREETKITAPSRAQRLAQFGDLFYQTVRPYQRNNYLFEKTDNTYVFSTGYAQMRPNIDGYLLLSFVQTDLLVKAVLDRCTGTSYPAINANDLAEMEVRIPPLRHEQEQIGAYFRNLDNLITLHQRKLSKLNNIKKAMLEKMFPQNGKNVPEIRFAGFTDAWEQRKLSQLGSIITGSTPSTQVKAYYSENGIPWVTPTDISDNVTFRTAKHITNEGQKVARVVPKNTILVTCIASIGKNTMLGTTGSFNQQINGLLPNEKENHPYFLLAESTLWSDKMKRTAASGTMQIVNKTEFSEIDTYVPPLDEQKLIGEYFQNLDNLITLHQRKLDKLMNIKKSMLEKMFV
ncbi:MAG: restriction endonuclease subunit S [Clostridiaceae bacterium]